MPRVRNPSNHERALNAAVALQKFVTLSQLEGEDTATRVSDLLADLMHLDGRMDFDFDAQLARARRNYDAEARTEYAKKKRVRRRSGVVRLRRTRK